MTKSDFIGTYKSIFKDVISAALFAIWFATMLVCALAYFDCLTR